MNSRRPACPRRVHKSPILALTRRERALLTDLRTRRAGVQRVLNSLDAQINFILSRVPDHKIIVPKLPPAAERPIQPSLF
jgi:hypothetical protein